MKETGRQTGESPGKKQEGRSQAGEKWLSLVCWEGWRGAVPVWGRWLKARKEEWSESGKRLSLPVLLFGPFERGR